MHVVQFEGFDSLDFFALFDYCDLLQGTIPIFGGDFYYLLYTIFLSWCRSPLPVTIPNSRLIQYTTKPLSIIVG